MTDAKNPGLTETEVRMAYRMILGREAESDAVDRIASSSVPRHRRRLRRVFLTADEFRSEVQGLRSNMIPEVARGYWSTAQPIDVTSSPKQSPRVLPRARAINGRGSGKPIPIGRC